MIANDIARAICAAAKETGADPIDVALGNDRSLGYPVDKKIQVSRARAYAGRALDHVFNLPVATIARPFIAKLIGASRASSGSFFSSLDGRPTPWWDGAACGRVISAIEAGVVRSKPISAPAAAPAPRPAVQQRVPDSKPKTPIGTLEPSGFRPAPDTIKKVLQDDAAEKRFSAPYVPVGRPATKKNDDFLRRAVENTAKMTPPPED